MRLTALRNILLASGAYYVSAWWLGPVVWLWSFVSNRLSFTVGIETMLLMPLVMGVPEIVLACGAGAAVAATAESPHPSRWALLPAGLFAMQRVFAQRWSAQPPTFEDHVSIAVGAILPAVACILAATFAEGRLGRRLAA